MRKAYLVTLLLTLFGTLAVAETYKWIDDSGEVHYGDSPPANVNTQKIYISEGPSKEDIERQQQQIKELIEQYQQERQLTSPSSPEHATPTHRIYPEDVACFSPLSDLVQGPSAHYYAPISPSSLAKKEQATLKKLLAKIKTRGTWRGAMFELECWDEFPERNELPSVKYRSTDVEMEADWDKSESLLTLNIESPYSHSLVYRLAVFV